METDNRRTELAHVREMVSAVQAECETLRRYWPDRYPVPPDVDAAFNIEDAIINQARSIKRQQ